MKHRNLTAYKIEYGKFFELSSGFPCELDNIGKCDVCEFIWQLKAAVRKLGMPWHVEQIGDHTIEVSKINCKELTIESKDVIKRRSKTK